MDRVMEEEIEIKLPKLGESIVQATVIQWFKQVGEVVDLDEPLLEVSTDKVNSEIPSPVAGKVKAILAQPDDQVDVGAPLAVIVAIGAASSPAAAPEPLHTCKQEAAPAQTKKGVFSPVVLRLAKAKGIDLSELEKIPATGAGGRLSKRDLEAYLATTAAEKSQPKKSQETATSDQVERMKLSPLRKMIAEKLTRSFYEAPHATLVNEVDMTGIVRFIAQHKEQFLRDHGYKLSVTSFLAQSIARAVQEYPLINASLEEDMIVVKRFVHLGIAVSVENGILVPVIQNCHRLAVREIAKEVAQLSEQARRGELTPNHVGMGTLTMTNFGMSGTAIGIPIIHYPEVAIVGVGAIQKKVVVSGEDQMAIRSMMHLSLTFDHRVIDGIYGCNFLAAVKAELEKPPLPLV